ncbi:hypothetical protein GCM10027073_67530 [Streptomyces chlorus]
MTRLVPSERVHKALVCGYAMPNTEQSRRRSRLAVEVGANLLDLAFRESTEGDPEILADAALMMDLYLFAPSQTSRLYSSTPHVAGRRVGRSGPDNTDSDNSLA